MSRSRDWVITALVATPLLLILALMLVAIRSGWAKDACESRHGRVERYNVHTIYVTMPCGSSCAMTVPQETSDWRCVGGDAEAP